MAWIIFPVIFLLQVLVMGNVWAKKGTVREDSVTVLYPQRLCKHQLHGGLFSKTELIFGLSRAKGKINISEAEFQHFVDTVVTPRFPEGLTLLSGIGQFRNAAGSVLKEEAKLLILFYPISKRNNLAIEQIRTAYKQAFQQESVLRADELACVSF